MEHYLGFLVAGSERFLVGVGDIGQVQSVPADARLRIIMRVGNFVRAYVKTSNTITLHYLVLRGDKITLGPRYAANMRT